MKLNKIMDSFKLVRIKLIRLITNIKELIKQEGFKLITGLNNNTNSANKKLEK